MKNIAIGQALRNLGSMIVDEEGTILSAKDNQIWIDEFGNDHSKARAKRLHVANAHSSDLYVMLDDDEMVNNFFYIFLFLLYIFSGSRNCRKPSKKSTQVTVSPKFITTANTPDISGRSFAESNIIHKANSLGFVHIPMRKEHAFPPFIVQAYITAYTIVHGLYFKFFLKIN